MLRKRLRLFALVTLAVSLPAAAAAQQQQGAPTPSNLILQVVYFEGAPTAFQLVPSGPEMVGSWFGRFKTIPRRPAAQGALPVHAVNVVSRAEGEGVQIKVSVFTGERHFDREELVGTYTAGAGEQVVVKELERFGVEPFRVTVRPLRPNPAAPPVIVNKTQSVEASITAFDSSKGVSARLALRNLSSKRVLAVEYSETREGRVVWTRFTSGPEGEPLLEPGGVHTSGISQVHRGEVTPDGFYVPHAPEAIVVGSAVFDDGTHEGDPLPAARLWAQNEGARAQLTRSLALLRKARAGAGGAARLKEQVAALGSDADASVAEHVARRYPGLTPADRELAKSAAEVSMHKIRRELLDGLTALEREPDAGKLREWLAAKREKFEGWLGRLKP